MRAKRFRYWVATQLNRLPGQCWARLVTWAEFRRDRWPWSPQDSVCLRDFAREGVCYCGKLRIERQRAGR